MRITDLENGAVQYRAAKVEDISDHEMYVRAVPYSDTEWTDIGGGIREQFKPGAFARAANAPHRVAFYHGHSGPLVGRATAVEDRPDGCYVRAKIGRTAAAEEMLSLVADQILDSVSIEFRAMPDFVRVQRDGDLLQVTHRRAILTGVAAVPEAAYEGQSLILSARDAQRERDAEAARAWFQAWRRS